MTQNKLPREVMSDNSDSEESTGENDVSPEEDSDEDDSENSDTELTNFGTSSTVNAEENDEDEEKEDPVVKAILKECEKTREHPPDINSEDFVVDVSFHPSDSLLAAAIITGDVHMYKYSKENVELVSTLELHMKACRAIEFSMDGALLLSSSKDKSIMVSDVSSDKLKLCYENAHEEPIFCLLIINEHLFASGDDNGTIKLWDLRRRNAVCSMKEVDDYVSCMMSTSREDYLVCSSGEGTVTSFELGTRKLFLQSEVYDAELTCLATMRSETKLLVGSSKGTFYLFNWGEFGYHSDEFPGAKHAINCLTPITENIVVCAGEDGVIRANHCFPQRHLGVVGQHQFSIESLDISGDGCFIASCSHDNTIKFWNIKYFEDMKVDGRKKARKKEINHNLPSSKCSNVSDFFSDLV